MTTKSIRVLTLVLGASVAACDQGPTASDPVPAQVTSTQGALLDHIREATARYHDVAAATAAGYVRASPCVYNTPGSKAIHYQKAPLVDAVIEPAAPEVLLYEPTQNGEPRLVGVEFLIPSAAWDAVHSSIPMLGDRPFMDRRSPPFGAPIPNYALYVWIWRDNPNGIFEQYNPNVSCAFADVSIIA
ncbi:MAG TPA: hypothetical protein VI485_30885 [Vicinamibacterales bacterium]|nr:hypothetical protein [Vicinamibacterales bacterium]